MNSALYWKKRDSSFIHCSVELWLEYHTMYQLCTKQYQLFVRKRDKKDNDASNKELETAVHLLDTLGRRSSVVQRVIRKWMTLKCVNFQMLCNFFFFFFNSRTEYKLKYTRRFSFFSTNFPFFSVCCTLDDMFIVDFHYMSNCFF